MLDAACWSTAVGDRAGAATPLGSNDCALRQRRPRCLSGHRTTLAGGGVMTDCRQSAVDYLSVRRALGFKLRGHDRLLADFLDHLERSGATAFTSQAALAWATGLPDASPTQWAHRLSVVRGFARHLQCLDQSVEVPPSDLLVRRHYRPAAHLYSDADITGLLEVAATLRPALRGATYQTLFGLLSVTGMRIGEAIGLDRDNVDLRAGVVHIPLTKFRKHRRLP